MIKIANDENIKWWKYPGKASAQGGKLQKDCHQILEKFVPALASKAIVDLSVIEAKDLMKCFCRRDVKQLPTFEVVR